MKSLVCIDAGVLIKLLVEEEHSDRASALWGEWLESETQVISPLLLPFEVVSVLRKQVYRGLITPEEGENALAMAQTAKVTLLSPPGLHRRAWELAIRFNRPAAYDAHYLALAEIMGCEFWTADERLANAVQDELPWVRWLGDYDLAAKRA